MNDNIVILHVCSRTVEPHTVFNKPTVNSTLSEHYLNIDVLMILPKVYKVLLRS